MVQPGAFAIPSNMCTETQRLIASKGRVRSIGMRRFTSNTTITERIRLEIRMEAFDYINHAKSNEFAKHIANSQPCVTTGRSDSRIVESAADYVLSFRGQTMVFCGLPGRRRSR